MPNNPIKSILIDDEPLALEVLKSHLVNFPRIEIVNTFSNPGDAMNWLESNQVDVVFTDIQMPGITGLELVKNQYPAPHAVIFTTAHTNFAADAFEFEALDYLLKPISFARFAKACEKIYDEFPLKNKIDVLVCKSLSEQMTIINSAKMNLFNATAPITMASVLNAPRIGELGQWINTLYGSDHLFYDNVENFDEFQILTPNPKTLSLT